MKRTTIHRKLEQLAANHAEDAWRIAYALLRHRADAEDAVQSAFVAVARKGGRLEADTLWPWFVGALRIECLRLRRKRMRDLSNADPNAIKRESPMPDPSTNAEQRELTEQMLDSLDGLAALPRDALVLIHAGGLSVTQAADILKVSRSTAHRAASEGLAAIAKRLGNDESSAQKKLSALAVPMPAAGLSSATSSWVVHASSLPRSLMSGAGTKIAASVIGVAAIGMIALMIGLFDGPAQGEGTTLDIGQASAGTTRSRQPGPNNKEPKTTSSSANAIDDELESQSAQDSSESDSERTAKDTSTHKGESSDKPTGTKEADSVSDAGASTEEKGQSAPEEKAYRLGAPKYGGSSSGVEITGLATVTVKKADGSPLPLTIGSDDKGRVSLWRYQGVDTIREHRFQAHDTRINGIAGESFGWRIATVGRDGNLRIWDIQKIYASKNENPEPELTIPAHSYYASDVAFGHRENTAFTVGANKHLAWWNLTDGSSIQQIMQKSRTTHVDVLSSSKHRLVAVGTEGGEVIVYDYSDGLTEKWRAQIGEAGVGALRFHHRMLGRDEPVLLACPKKFMIHWSGPDGGGAEDIGNKDAKLQIYSALNGELLKTALDDDEESVASAGVASYANGREVTDLIIVGFQSGRVCFFYGKDLKQHPNSYKATLGYLTAIEPLYLRNGQAFVADSRGYFFKVHHDEHAVGVHSMLRHRPLGTVSDIRFMPSKSVAGRPVAHILYDHGFVERRDFSQSIESNNTLKWEPTLSLPFSDRSIYKHQIYELYHRALLIDDISGPLGEPSLLRQHYAEKAEIVPLGSAKRTNLPVTNELLAADASHKGGMRWLTVEKFKLARLWAPNGELVAELKAEKKPYFGFILNAREEVITFDQYSDNAHVYDLRTGDHLTTFKGYSGQALRGEVSQSENYHIFPATEVAMLRDLRTRAIVQRFEIKDKDISAAAISWDDAIVATGTEDGQIDLWDRATGEHLKTLRGHEAEISALAFSPDGKLLASGSTAPELFTWDLTEKRK